MRFHLHDNTIIPINNTGCCSHINSHDQVRGHRTGSSHSGAEEYPREKSQTERWYTHISQLTHFMPGILSTLCVILSI